MKNATRSWKDEDFRADLSEEELNSLPANPAGQTWSVMNETELRHLLGGRAIDAADGISTFRPLSCGRVCTATTECPIFSFCCAEVEIG